VDKGGGRWLKRWVKMEKANEKICKIKFPGEEMEREREKGGRGGGRGGNPCHSED